MNIFKFLSKKDYLSIIICIGLIVAQVWLDLKMPEYLNKVIDNASNPGHTLNDVLINGGLMLACAISSALLAVLTGFLTAKTSSRFSKSLRNGVFDKVQSFSTEEIHKFSTASLITRSTNDITQIQMTVAMGLQVMIKAPILAIWAICKIVNSSILWTSATAIAVVAILITVITVLIITLPKFRKMQKQTDDVNNVMREGLRGVRVVRAYNAENYQEEKFEKVNNNLYKTNIFTNSAMSIMMPIMMLCMSGLTLAIYIIACYIFNDTSILARGEVLGDMMEFSSYALQVVMAFMLLIMVFIMLPRAITSAKRLNEVLFSKTSIQDGKITNILNDLNENKIEFNNVSFKYPNAEEYVLKNINLNINKGETIAFIGSTGSGKSTLINLIPRFYDVTEGEIKIDGVNIKDYTLNELHDKISYVSQKAVLFSGTVAENINFGEKQNLNLTEEDMLKALEIAQGKDFVLSLDKGLDSHIEQGGANLSGGQKQRISIARAIARNAEIYIFDDSFSALDYKTDQKLRKSLKENMKNATILIVAQRIGTIKNADKIVVLENGNAVGIGTHEELLQNCAVYKEIALSQLSKEELENE